MAPRRKVRAYNPWSKDDLKALKRYSREKTPVPDIAKTLKRSEGTIRQKAYSLGISLGYRRRRAA